MLLSRSRFLTGLQCPKRLWWTVHEPDAPQLTVDGGSAVFERGTKETEMKRWVAGAGWCVRSRRCRWPRLTGAQRLQAAAAAAEAKDAKAKKELSDAQIRKILIDESIAAYSGNCPCPYSTMSNGRNCGRWSAYSRDGGEPSLCYAKDVTAEMVQQYRDANSLE